MYLFIYDYVIIKNKKKEFQYKLQIIICYAKKKKKAFINQKIWSLFYIETVYAQYDK